MAAAARARAHQVRVLSYARMYPQALFPGRTQLDPDPVPAATATIDRAALIDSCAPWTWPRAASWLAGWAPDVVVAQRWHPFFAPALAAGGAPGPGAGPGARRVLPPPPAPRGGAAARGSGAALASVADARHRRRRRMLDTRRERGRRVARARRAGRGPTHDAPGVAGGRPTGPGGCAPCARHCRRRGGVPLLRLR